MVTPKNIKNKDNRCINNRNLKLFMYFSVDTKEIKKKIMKVKITKKK